MPEALPGLVFLAVVIILLSLGVIYLPGYFAGDSPVYNESLCVTPLTCFNLTPGEFCSNAGCTSAQAITFIRSYTPRYQVGRCCMTLTLELGYEEY